MKIEYIDGDLFLTEHPVIVHGCNTLGVMGAGVAKEIRERYPLAHDQYQKSPRFLGTISAAVDTDRKIPNAQPKLIVNAITQSKFGRAPVQYVDYDAIGKCMERVDELVDWVGQVWPEGRGVAMPMIGAGLGGGDWKIIEAIIEEKMKNLKPYVYVL